MNKKDDEQTVEFTKNRARKILSQFRKGHRGGWSLVHEVWILQDPVRVYKKGNQRMWVIKNGLIGAGFLEKNKTRETWQVLTAYIAKKYRRQGLYTAVLSYLRDWLHMPIESGKLRSGAAEKVWLKIGVFDPSAARYRLNPGKNTVGGWNDDLWCAHLQINGRPLTLTEKEHARAYLIAYATEGVPQKRRTKTRRRYAHLAAGQ